MRTKTGLFWTIVTMTLLAAVPGETQRRTASDDQWCRDQNWGNDRAGVCEVREFTMPASGSLTVDASPNGGIRVEGAPRADIQVRARLVATADTEARARQIAAGVRVQPSGDRVQADGPDGLERRESWHVSYEIAVPSQTSLSLTSRNGGIIIRDVEGRIEFSTTNGGVKLANLNGDVKGRTTNGGVDIELDGAMWIGEGLDVQTTNGGVRLAIPDNYSAQLETGTVNGGVSSELPVVVRGRRDRNIEATLGAGGAPIRVRTSNGGVRITRR